MIKTLSSFGEPLMKFVNYARELSFMLALQVKSGTAAFIYFPEFNYMY